MSGVASRISGLISELKRRHVFRIAIGYGVVAFILAQVADIAVPALNLPSWVLTFIILCLVLGFPLALVLAWAFDITPLGVRRTEGWGGPSAQERRVSGGGSGVQDRRRTGSPSMGGTGAATGPSAPPKAPRPPELKEPEATTPRTAQSAPPGTGPVAPPDPERVERASLAQLRDELRTPASAIVGYSRALLEDATGPAREKLRADLLRIHTAGELFLTRLEQLLDAEHLTWNGAAAERGELLSRLRHDLRTPLNAIIGYSELILEAELSAEDEAMAGDVRRILAAGRRVLVRIEDIVHFAEAGSGAMDLSRTSALAQEVLAKLSLLPSAAGAIPLRQGRLLVVDDVEANRDLITHQLARQGYTVSAAASGRAALEQLATQEFDLLLLDILMPEMDGVEVLRQLKADPSLRELPVIVISALDEVDSVIRCMQMGAEDFVSKPFDPVLLGARIGRVLEVRQMREREHAFADALQRERHWTDTLLGRSFPSAIAAKLKAGETHAVESTADATVLVAGYAGSALPRGGPSALIDRLGNLFARFDALAEPHGIDIVKTTSQFYLVTIGLPAARSDHARIAGDLALAMQDETRKYNEQSADLLRLRIGIHSGPVVAGLIASQRVAFDVWGEAVDTAQQLQLNAAPDTIQVSPATYTQLRDHYEFTSRGVVEIPGKGQMRTYLLQGRLE
jgi:adenylate cyclase